MLYGQNHTFINYMTVLPAYYHLVFPMVYFCSVFRSACLHSGFHRHTLLASPYRGFWLTFLCSLCFWLNFATSIFLSMKSSATTCSGKWLLTNSYPFRTYICVHTSDSVSASCVKVFSRDVTVLGWYLCTKKKCSYNAVYKRQPYSW